MTRSALLSALVVGLVLSAGCPASTGGSADSGSTSAGETGSTSTTATTTTTPPPSTSITASASTSTGDTTDGSTTSATTDGPSTTGTAGTTGTTGALDQCLAAYEELMLCTEAAECRCDACGTELNACLNDVGCSALRDCTIETGCMGIDCLAPENCEAEFEMHGGPGGDAAQLLLAVSACLEGAGCPPCTGGTGTTTTG